MKIIPSFHHRALAAAVVVTITNFIAAQQGDTNKLSDSGVQSSFVRVSPDDAYCVQRNPYGCGFSRRTKDSGFRFTKLWIKNLKGSPFA